MAVEYRELLQIKEPEIAELISSEQILPSIEVTVFEPQPISPSSQNEFHPIGFGWVPGNEQFIPASVLLYQEAIFQIHHGFQMAYREKYYTRQKLNVMEYDKEENEYFSTFEQIQ